MFRFCFCFGHFNYVSRFHAAGLGATTQAPSQQHALHLDWLMVLRRQRKPRAISAVFTADIFCLPASCCHFIEPNAYPLLRRQRAHFSFGAVVYGTCCLSPPLEARQLHSSPLLFFPLCVAAAAAAAGPGSAQLGSSPLLLSAAETGSGLSGQSWAVIGRFQSWLLIG